MSITLTTPFTLSGSISETDPTGAVMGFAVDLFASTVTFTLRQGNIQSGNLNAGAFAPTTTFTVNWVTGEYTSSNGKSGTVPPGTQLNNFINQMKADRNLAESFAAGGSGIMPGVQVPW